MTLKKVKAALKMAAMHKYGDGDYTAFFEEALAELKAYMEIPKDISKDRYHYGYVAAQKEYMERLSSKKLIKQMVEAYLKRAVKTTKCRRCKGECNGAFSRFCTCDDGRTYPTKYSCMKAAINVIKGE